MTSEPLTYDPVIVYDFYASEYAAMEVCGHGDWVSYEDYSKLKAVMKLTLEALLHAHKETNQLENYLDNVLFRGVLGNG